MKKDLIFAPLLLIVGVALALLKVTCITTHIILSVVGIALLVVYTVLTKKAWKNTAMEIAMRASYGIALITGIILKINYIAFLGIIHKIFAILFLVALIVLFIQKIITKKKN